MADETRRRLLKWLGSVPGVAWVLGPSGCTTDDAVAGGAGRSKDDTTISGDDATGESASPDIDTCRPTGSDVEGPFYREGSPRRQVLASQDELGERLVVEGIVSGPDCQTPLSGAMIDVWHADTRGNYHGPESEYRLRGQMKTDSEGRFRFETIRPGHYPLGDSMRPAHIHFIVSHPGHEPLTTQLYFAGDPYLADDDPCDVCNSDDPTHIVDLDESDESGIRWHGTFDIVLST